MARHYHVDIAVFAADADRKWVDNLLSHFDVPGVESARQGVARRISAHGIHHIALTWRLASAGGLSLASALAASRELLQAPNAAVQLAPALTLELNRADFLAEIDSRIGEGVESIVPKRRGRPPAGK
jgi:hypothetical protein